MEDTTGILNNNTDMLKDNDVVILMKPHETVLQKHI